MTTIQERLTAALGATYRIERELGGGGMSHVFVAQEVALARRVVIKVLPPEFGGGVAADRFRQEVQVAARLQHPHIVPVLQTGEADGLLYYTMPFVEGESLKDRLQREGRLPIGDAVRILRDVADALAEAHSHGLVHRDIKPGNILISKQHAVVTDFGVSKALKAAAEGGAAERPGRGMTTIGLAIGTPTYMAPEQAAADPDADHRMDLYALGIVGYEMLTGSPPFSGTTPQAVLAAQLTKIQRPIRELRSEVPPDLSDLIDRLLRKQAADRLASAVELRERLEQPGFGTTGSLAAARAGGSGIWSRKGAAVGAALIIGALVLLRLGGLLEGRSLVAQGLLDEKDGILVADMNSPGPDSALAASLTEALRIDLSQSKTIRLIGEQEISQTLTLMQRPDTTRLILMTAREVAQRVGAKAVLSADIQPVGRGFLITAQLVTADSGVSLAAFRQTAADSSEVLPALDRLSRQLRRRIGESLRAVNASTELQQVTTPSLEALRKYSQAIQLMESNKNVPQAIVLLEEAVRLDSGFAMAWRKLGVAYDGVGDPARAQSARARAFANKDRLTERERYLTIGTYYGSIEGEEPKAIAAYRALLEGSPNDGWALNNVGILYSNQRQYDQAESMFARALAADSGNYAATLNLMPALINQGKLAPARSLLTAARRRFAGTPGLHYMAADVMYAEGNIQDAMKELEAGLGESGTDPLSVASYRALLAQYALLQGKVNQADQIFADLESQNERLGRPEMSLGATLARAQIQLRFRNNRAAALATIDRGLARHPWNSISAANRPYLAAAYLLAQAGAAERARTLLAESARVQTLPMVGTRAYREMIEANIATTERRGSDAVRQSGEALKIASCYVCNLPDVARAWEAAGQSDSALATWQEYVTRPESFRINTDGVDLAFAWQRLGTLYEEAGNREKARDAWGHLVDQWRDADAELQPQVQDAKRHLAKLSGEAGTR
jgi:serine/threonine-protein kinase